MSGLNPNAHVFIPGGSWTDPPSDNVPVTNGPSVVPVHPAENNHEEIADSWDQGIVDEQDQESVPIIIPPSPPNNLVDSRQVGDTVVPPEPPFGAASSVTSNTNDDKSINVLNDHSADSSGRVTPDEDSGDFDDERIVKKAANAFGDSSLKEHVNVIFIGHVDAGKSTIGGHIMYLTGMVDKRTLEKYEREAKEKNRESWYLSWALDTNAEEREKGKTVEVGRAYFETENKHFTILDAPGHKSFVPNMIGGASQADLAVLVISARRGEFETGFERGGQTREHAMLVKTAGVRHLVILINKMDDPTVEWSLERFTECKEKLLPYLKKVGFNPKTDIFFIPCSGLTGAFLMEPAPESDVSWYRGPCFIPYVDSLPSMSRTRDGPIRLPIVDKYNDMGTIILGKLESGVIQKGQNIMLMPNRTTVQVTNLYRDDDEVEEVVPGENIKVKLKGVEEDEIMPGFVICSLDNACTVGRLFDAQVVVLEHKSIICPGYSAVLHIHTAVEEITVKLLLCTIDRKGEKSKTRPRFVKQDQICIMRLECQETFCLEPFKNFPQMGRFTLRDEGKTIAIGKVLKLVE